MGKENQNIFRGACVKIKFAEMSDEANRQAPLELQLFRAGTYFHEQYGKIEITPEILNKMVFNFKENVRGIEVALDYKHDSEGEAAAWFEDIYTKENGQELWFRPRWTRRGQDTILSEEFKYISPDFTLGYVDNQTLKNHGPVVLGAGLTNRPFIKGMQPITLSENEGYKMDELQKLKEENALLKAENEKLKAAAAGKTEMEVETKMSDTAKKELAEKEKQLADMKAENDKLMGEKKLSEKNKEFDIMLSEGKVCEAQRKSFLAGDMAEFAKNQKALNFSEKGHGGDSNSSSEKDGDIQDQVIKLAEKKIAENKNLKMKEAMKMVLSENPKMNEEYSKLFN